MVWEAGVRRIPFTQVDAFADAAFGGNPAAVMPFDAWPDDDVLLRIAVENNLSETAFLIPSGEDGVDYDLRWFTPAAEVALCGHATLASGHAILSADQARGRVRFRTRRSGVLEVARDGDGYAMSLPAWVGEARPLPDVVAALGWGEGSGVRVVETMWHDSGYGLVVTDDAAAVRACAPDMASLAALGPYVLIVSAPGEEVDFVSRVFTPAYAIPEDPVTGSAHAMMTPYWAARLSRSSLTAYQASARGGRLTCRLQDDRVVRCVTVIEGSFILP